MFGRPRDGDPAGVCLASGGAIDHLTRFRRRTPVRVPQEADLDHQHFIVNLLAREELAARPTDWLRLQGGIEFRANDADQVDDSWQPDIRDRGLKRPLLSIRRLDATVSRRHLTVDAGKQFIRWAGPEIVTPTDRFAPRDYLNVFDTEYLAVPGVRVLGQFGAHSLDAVWVPVFTPSRIPLPGKRWTVLPPERQLPTRSTAPFPRDGRQACAGHMWGAATRSPDPSSMGSTTCR